MLASIFSPGNVKGLKVMIPAGFISGILYEFMIIKSGFYEHEKVRNVRAIQEDLERIEKYKEYRKNKESTTSSTT